VLLVCFLADGSARAAGPAFHYYGGKVVSNAKVVQVLWGTGFSTDVQNNLAPFYTNVLASSYIDWLSEYSTVGLNGVLDGLPGSNQRIGRGAFVGTYPITPSTTATTLTNAQVQTEIAAQINAGHLPAPTFDWQGDVNTVYMIDFPSGYKLNVQGSQSCVQFCAILDTLSFNGKSVGLGMFPDVTSGGCQNGCGTSATPFNNVTWVHSFELIQIITDTEIGIATSVARPLAWYANGSGTNQGDIADVCNGNTASVGGYTVAKGWSQSLNECIAVLATAPPICEGSTTHCTQCTSADDGQACTGSKAVCETDESNQAFGECVACATSAQCSGTTPVCNKADAGNDTCRACAADLDCTGNSAGPHCLSTGACGAAPVTDAGSGSDGGSGGSGGSGSSSKSGCSTSGSGPAGVLVVLVLLAMFLGRRRSAVR
jgi:uncharacterized protein (TIGR03382 family)